MGAEIEIDNCEFSALEILSIVKSGSLSENRDIHAANNMIWFYENNVGVGRTKLKRVETKALVDGIIAANQTVNL